MMQDTGQTKCCILTLTSKTKDIVMWPTGDMQCIVSLCHTG